METNKHLYFVVAEVSSISGKVTNIQEFQMDSYLEEAFPTDIPSCQKYEDKIVYGFGIYSTNKQEQEQFKNIFVNMLF